MESRATLGRKMAGMAEIDDGRKLLERIHDGDLAQVELTKLLVVERNRCVAESPRGEDAAYDCAHVAAIRYGIPTETARSLIDEADAEAGAD